MGVDGLKVPHGRRKLGHTPDDLSSTQDTRSLRSQVGILLARGTLSSIAQVFEMVKTERAILEIVHRFLNNELPLVDLRLEDYREALQPDRLRATLREHAKPEYAELWAKAISDRASGLPFPSSAVEAARCLGGLAFGKAQINADTLHEFLMRGLSAQGPPPGTWFAALFEGSQEDPKIAAEIVYGLIRAIRDSGKKSVLEAFFEGFAIEATVPTGTTAQAMIQWNAAPMLKALVKSNQETLAHCYESFIRHYLGKIMRSDGRRAAKWQMKYDQHFQMLLNLASGKFHASGDYEYGSTP